MQGAAACLLLLLRRRRGRITRLLLHRCAPLAHVAALVPALACQGRQRAGREVHRPRWRRVCSWQAAPCLLPCLPPPPSSSLAGVSTAAALSSDAAAAGSSTVGGVTSVVEMVEAAGSAVGVASSALSLLPPRCLPLPRRPCQRCQGRASGRGKRLANTTAHGGERGELRAALSVLRTSVYLDFGANSGHLRCRRRRRRRGRRRRRDCRSRWRWWRRRRRRWWRRRRRRRRRRRQRHRRRLFLVCATLSSHTPSLTAPLAARLALTFCCKLSRCKLAGGGRRGGGRQL